jgi:hypothetical protein
LLILKIERCTGRFLDREIRIALVSTLNRLQGEGWGEIGERGNQEGRGIRADSVERETSVYQEKRVTFNLVKARLE